MTECSLTTEFGITEFHCNLFQFSLLFWNLGFVYLTLNFNSVRNLSFFMCNVASQHDSKTLIFLSQHFLQKELFSIQLDWRKVEDIYSTLKGEKSICKET